MAIESRMTAAALSVAALMVAAGQAAAADDKGELSLAKILDGRVAGEPVTCLETGRAFGAEIVDKTAIVYRMPDGALYVNRPQAGAASLDRQSVLQSRPLINSSCRGDRVDVIESGGKGGLARSSVLLGVFTPYAKIKR